ncbi:hypothetical protein D8674_029468 [Pyrus ussuriensis x Pyrus communis]|uniref:Uncharacterized protein n=1 Tax=Pyrus ussuriensis x Pyrus communis TaxID=2448454 RepID=A0A5N5I3X8_9ROSA|nr:hypothetical protein D8674_029468 [Pyrus ussuriensis x Pyrus communis]
MASRTLSDAGYNLYEISSYCKSGYHCKHNLTYWKNKPFYAFGLSSASYVGGVRFLRPKRVKEYTGYVENMENYLVECGESPRTVQDMATDVVILSLRTSRCLDLKYFGEAYGSSLVLSLCKAYKPYVESGHVVFFDEQGRAIAADEFNTLLVNEDKTERSPAHIRLSDPDGFLLSNELISLAFAVVALASEERFYSCTYRCHSQRENGAAENHGRNMRHSSDKRPAEYIKKPTGSSSRHWGGIAEKKMLRSIET